MDRYLKIGFLVIVLAIPAAIFIFLRSFGDNRFDVDIFYKDGLKGVPFACVESNDQYKINDSILPLDGSNKIVAFKHQPNNAELNNIALRLNETFNGNARVFCFVQDSIDNQGLNYELIYTDDLTKTSECGFITGNLQKLVLVDKMNRIRGYYSRDLDEIDRLIVELKILFENDQRDAG